VRGEGALLMRIGKTIVSVWRGLEHEKQQDVLSPMAVLQFSSESCFCCLGKGIIQAGMNERERVWVRSNGKFKTMLGAEKFKECVCVCV